MKKLVGKDVKTCTIKYVSYVQENRKKDMKIK